MAKRKKQKKAAASAKRPSFKLMNQIATAMALFEEGDGEAARAQLIHLVAQHPRSKPPLLALLEVCHELEDWHTMAFYSEKLLPLERGNDRAETLNNLVFAHIQMMYPGLAWYYAKELVTNHPNFEQVKQIQALMQTSESFLLEQAEVLQKTAVRTPAENLNMMVEHDRVRFYTESGHPEAAIHAAESLLQKVPDMVPVLNNLSLSQFLTGSVALAITTAQKVLAIAPQNFHALSNLVRYTFLTGEFKQAQEYAQQLQQVQSNSPELALKQAEALALLGDDEGVRSVYQQAKTQPNDEMHSLLLHLAAVAHYRLGDEKTAWQLWRKASKQLPHLKMAQASLAEKSLPPGKRDIPWYWSFDYWFTPDFNQELNKALGKDVQHTSERELEQVIKGLVAQRPYLPQLFPHMLERGDRTTRELILNFIRIIQAPEMLQTLYDFARGPYGSDDLRLEAIQFISQNRPSLLPEDRQVPMWINGQQTELLMIGFEITDEPELVEELDQKILDKHEVAYELLFDEKVDEAEQLLHEIIAEAPEFPSAYNHLAVAYERQGRKQEARKLMEEIYARFPDYLFARVGLARILTQEDRIEEARDLLRPILQRQKLHISEFRALARAQMDVILAEGNQEGARTWLSLWQQVEEENPELIEWQMRIDGPGKFIRGLQNLMGGQRRKGKK